MPKTVEITTDRGVWGSAGERLSAGDRATFDDEIADALIEAGIAKASRAKASRGRGDHDPETDADARPEVETDATH